MQQTNMMLADYPNSQRYRSDIFEQEKLSILDANLLLITTESFISWGVLRKHIWIFEKSSSFVVVASRQTSNSSDELTYIYQYAGEYFKAKDCKPQLLHNDNDKRRKLNSC